MSDVNSKNTPSDIDYVDICRKSGLQLLKIVESQHHTMLLIEQQDGSEIMQRYVRCVDGRLFLNDTFRWERIAYTLFQPDTEKVKLANLDWKDMWYHMLWDNGEIIDDRISLWSKSMIIKNRKDNRVELETDEWEWLGYYILNEDWQIKTFQLGDRIGYLEKITQNNSRQVFLKTEEGKKFGSYMLDDENKIRTVKLWDREVLVKRVRSTNNNIVELESLEWEVLWDYLLDEEKDSALSFQWWTETVFAARFATWDKAIDLKKANWEEIARAIFDPTTKELETIGIWNHNVVTTSKWFLTEDYRHITLKNDRFWSPLHYFTYEDEANKLQTIEHEQYIFTFDEASRNMYCFSQNLSRVDYKSLFDKETLKKISQQFKNIVTQRENVKKQVKNILPFKK